jgi:hypothetical protein
LLKMLSFLPHVFFSLFSKSGGVVMWIHSCVFYSVPLVFLSAFVPAQCYFYCYDSVV